MAMLYVHIPFCKRICAYCDFYKVGAVELLPSVVKQLHVELEARATYLKDRTISSIYFGGGTPSLVKPHDIEILINHARELFDCSSIEEITLEANPDDLTPEYIEALRRTSVNRISLGIQSFDDEVLRFMNRRHTAEEAVRAIENLRSAGFNNISADIIFGIAGFGDRLQSTLEHILALDVEHISAYHLTIEERTKLGVMMRKGEYTPIPDERSEEEYLHVHEALTAAGYEHYEVSNYAKPEHRAKHNSSYWRGVEYLGIGPGAHSFSKDNRTWCTSSAKQYGEGELLYESEELTFTDHLNEYIMTSLRTVEGIDLNTIEERFGKDYRKRIEGTANMWVNMGALQYQGSRLAIPVSKFLISDSVIEALFV